MLVNCTIDDGTQLDIEMQVSRIKEGVDARDDHQNLKGKSIYYLCDLFAKQPSIGRRYDRLEKARMDRDSDMITSFDNGKAAGEAKKANEIARNLKSLGIDWETIAQASGLSLAQIQAL